MNYFDSYCTTCIVFDFVDPSMFEYVQHSPIVDSNQFITKLLFYSVPGDTFAYQSQSNRVFASFYKVNIIIDIVEDFYV